MVCKCQAVKHVPGPKGKGENARSHVSSTDQRLGSNAGHRMATASHWILLFPGETNAQFLRQERQETNVTEGSNLWRSGSDFNRVPPMGYHVKCVHLPYALASLPVLDGLSTAAKGFWKISACSPQSHTDSGMLPCVASDWISLISVGLHMDYATSREKQGSVPEVSKLIPP